MDYREIRRDGPSRQRKPTCPELGNWTIDGRTRRNFRDTSIEVISARIPTFGEISPQIFLFPITAFILLYLILALRSMVDTAITGLKKVFETIIDTFNEAQSTIYKENPEITEKSPQIRELNDIAIAGSELLVALTRFEYYARRYEKTYGELKVNYEIPQMENSSENIGTQIWNSVAGQLFGGNP